MSPANKSKTESAPQWCVLNPQLFALTQAENEIVNRHDKIWRDHCEGAKSSSLHDVEAEWRSIRMDAEHGDEAALTTFKSCGSVETFIRVRRTEQAGRNARFNRDNCGTFGEVKGIAKRCRERVEKVLAEYRLAGEDIRRLIEVAPILNDDATSKMERLIGQCQSIENRTPSVFEMLGNHIDLIEIEEGAE
jgi:hypothetical protein